MHTRQSGFLLESLGLVLLILSLLAMQQMNRQFEQALDEEAVRRGKALALIRNVAHDYLVTYSSELLALTDIRGAVTLKNGTGDLVPVASGAQPRIDELRKLGLAPPNLTSHALGGGEYVIQIQKSLIDCVSPNCNLEGLVTISQPYVKGGAVDYARLGLAIGAIGPDGAYSKLATPATLSGFGGLWQADNPPVAGRGQLPGILAARFGYASSQLAIFYKRDGSTPLTGDMNADSHAINGVTTLHADGKITAKNFTTALYRTGGPCAADDENAFASSDAGAVLVCKGGQWKYANQNPVAPGTACVPDGTTGTSVDTGETLMCKRGIYVRLNNLIAKNVQVGRVVVNDDSLVPILPCEPGGTPENSLLIDYTAVDLSQPLPRQAMDAIAVRSGNNWRVSLKLIDTNGVRYSGNDYLLRAVMDLECQY